MKLLAFTLLMMTLFSFQKSGRYHTPPGTKAIGEDVYMFVFEVRNIDYQEFLFSIKDTETRRSNWPDATEWHKAYNSEYTHDSCWKDPAFRLSPVVGISYRQAIAYTDFLTKAVNSNYGSEQVYYQYRLPSKEEWLKMLSDNDELSWNDVLYPFEWSKKTSKKFVHLTDNVSEMLAEEGLAIGGNWQQRLEANTISYTKPESWLGFRVLCEVKVKK